jgi:hypothetical protein
MRKSALVFAFALCAPVAGCSCQSPQDTADSGMNLVDGMVRDTGRVLMDGNGFDVNWVPIDGNGFDVNPPLPDTGPVQTIDGNGFDVGPPGCFPAMCQMHTYQCGDCMDNDGDGLVDSADPDCLGPCGNNEGGFDPMIPGISLLNCSADCFYDQDGGNGNDGCVYDYRCDPLSPDVAPNTSHPDRCAYSMTTAMSTSTCPPTQPTQCHNFCGPLTPNGCDCFGCCEVQAGQFIFVGSIPDAGHAPCDPDHLNDPASCRPCTPVQDCLNPCGHCELCFNQHTLPPDCFPPPPADMGMPDANLPDSPYPDGGQPDAWVMPQDAWTPPIDSGIPPRCPPGTPVCGLPTDPPCPATFFCITGCCQYGG